MHSIAITRPQTTTTVGFTADEDLACRTTVRLLITASAPGVAQALAGRIHDASLRASFPLVHARAVDLPCEPRMLRETCSRLLADAAAGTLLISDVEQMALGVQDQYVELMEELEAGRAPRVVVRLMSCTTASLPQRIAAGWFSERLFYRLNTIHLKA